MLIKRLHVLTEVETLADSLESQLVPKDRATTSKGLTSYQPNNHDVGKSFKTRRFYSSDPLIS